MEQYFNRLVVFLILLIGIAYSGANDDTLFVSKTFTPINSFTDDIEGPAVDYDGTIYAVNYKHQSTIGKISSAGNGEIFVELAEGSTGNGIRFNSNGDMFIADYTAHNILKVDMISHKIKVFSHDSRMNQPNDIAITDNDIIYASDPDWTETGGNIWMIDTSGTASLLVSGMGSTNGIEVSPDNKTLYVNESDQYRLWAFDILQNGMLDNKRLLRQYDNSVLDGMRCDSIGNIYVTCYNKGKVYILDSLGESIRTVDLIGKQSTNIAFGGSDGKTCYVTVGSNGNMESFRTDTPGRSWVMRQKYTGIRGHSSLSLPLNFQLEQNYPNPFNSQTIIGYQLLKSGYVKLVIYNILGKRMFTLVDEKQNAGRYSINFKENNLNSGVYFTMLTVNGNKKIGKMLLLK